MTAEYGTRSTRTEGRTSIRTLTVLQQHQANDTQGAQQMNHHHYSFEHLLIPCGATDRTKLINIQGGATDKPPIDVRHTEQFNRTGRLNTAAIKNSYPSSNICVFRC